ncbi:MAG: histidine kinase [Vicinamibacteria bacterium]
MAALGTRLKLSFVVLISLVLAGNLLLIWQFRVARLQTDRLTAANQQLIAILRLQEGLRAFHQRLNLLVQAQDAERMGAEVEPLHRALLADVQGTRDALALLPAETRVDPAFMATLDAIGVTLPSQTDVIVSLARARDWNAVRQRTVNGLRSLESETAALVRSIDEDVTAEQALATARMALVQRRILVFVPATAVGTFLIAAFFGWAFTRQIAELRAEERLEERTRIARELHDTLLQGFISASMQLHVAVQHVPEASPARPIVERVLQLMRHVIEDGRNAVRGFRSIEPGPEPLERAFARVRQEQAQDEPVDFRVVVEGPPHPLKADARYEVYSIGREALVNAFRHSAAATIEVRLEYSPDQLLLLIRDDGCGIDPDVLKTGRDGHWGLSGMRERAERLGAVFKVLSRANAGTEVALAVPARRVFRARVE